MRHTVPILRRQKRFSIKYRSFLRKVIYVNPLVLVLFLFCWYQKRMARLVFVLIVKPLIILLFDIVIPFLD